MDKRVLPSEHFCLILSKNVDNEEISDADFRDFVRNTLSIVVYDDTPRED